MVEYCGRGVSVGRQYYHARKRSDESPLEYLYRLNVAGMRAKIPVKDGPPDARREHVEHFIGTLDNRELADQLLLLRLANADALEETLRAYQRGRSRQSKATMGSNKFRQKAITPPVPAPSKPARAVRVIRMESSSSESESDLSGSEPDSELRQVYMAAKPDRPKNSNELPSHKIADQADHQDRNVPLKPCSHCGSPNTTIWGVGKD